MGIGSDYKLVDRRAKPDPESEEGALKEGVYTTIGAAIKAGGGTIVLLPDTYEEAVMLEGGEKILSLAAAKNELEGDAGEDLPALTGDGVSTILGVSFHTVTLLGDAQLIGITVQQRGPGKWFAVACAGGSATITRCDIDGASSSCVGLTAVGASPTFTECKIHGSFTGAGVCAFGGAKATFEKCEIYNNKFSGVEVSGENTEIALKDCIIHSNRRDGVLVWDNARCTLEGNQLRRNYHCGLEVRDKATATATANIIETNDFGVLIALHGSCNLTENSICGNLITGVEISKADVGEEGAEPPPLSELTANKINYNLESGIKIWHQVLSLVASRPLFSCMTSFTAPFL
jgi:parallel beta-helix repeat protein